MRRQEQGAALEDRNRLGTQAQRGVLEPPVVSKWREFEVSGKLAHLGAELNHASSPSIPTLPA